MRGTINRMGIMGRQAVLLHPRTLVAGHARHCARGCQAGSWEADAKKGDDRPGGEEEQAGE